MSLGSFDSAPFRWTEPLDSGQYGHYVARFPKSPRGLGFRVTVDGTGGAQREWAGPGNDIPLRIAWAVTPVDTRGRPSMEWRAAETAARPYATRILSTVAEIIRVWVERTGARRLVYYPDDEKRDRIYRRMLRRAAPGVTFQTQRAYGKPEVTVTLP